MRLGPFRARRVLSRTRMRLSQFNLYLADAPEAGCTLVHNTFTGALAVLEDDAMRALRKADAGEPLSETDASLASDPDLRDPDVAMVVTSRQGEEREVGAWFERRRERETLALTIAVNRACNFACTYCCQAEVLDGAVMKASVAERVADWAAGYALAHGLRDVSLTFVGGEPLLHPRLIRAIAPRIREGIRRAGIGFSCAVTTNGYLLAPELVDSLMEVGLTHATVTLDGDASTHSATRRARNGEDSFARVFANAVTASRSIRVTVNGNYQPQTVAGFVALLDKLAVAGLSPGSTVCFSPALAALGAPRETASDRAAWGAEDAGAQIALYDRTLAVGFDAPPLDVVGPCQFHERHSYAVDVEGTLYPCPGFIGRPEWGVGSVRGAQGGPAARAISGSAMEERCNSCAFLPNCGGGCVAARLLHRDRATPCSRAYLEAVSEAAIRRRFDAWCA